MIIYGDCREKLKELGPESVQMCVTSPPYWGLRDYGHDDQLGLEETPEEYTANMVEVFSQVKRVLRDDGTLWLNLGDSYNGSGGDHKEGGKNDTGFQGNLMRGVQPKRIISLKPKDLVGIPWRVAFALQADGWYLRQDIIWHKPNPMPESVTDRCTKSHEYVFLLSKSEKYFYDADAISEPIQDSTVERYKTGWDGDRKRGWPGNSQNNMHKYMGSEKAQSVTHRNKRSVWTVNTKPYSEAHFAVFPQELIEPCIQAGSKTGDVVLDPFFGSGTTGEVAERFGRNYVGIELNEEYKSLQHKRCAQMGLGF